MKDIRRARRCKGPEALLEGPHLIVEALAAGIELRSVLATADLLASAPGQELRAALPMEPLLVDPRLLAEVTDSDSPRGIVAIASLPRTGLASLPLMRRGIYVFADGVQDPGNLGALARVAEASGATALCLGPGTAQPNHPRALRASAGSLLRSSVAVNVTSDGLTAHLAALEPTWIALVPHGGGDLYAPFPSGCLVVAIGAESGLSEEALEQARIRTTIAVEPPVESLNTTVAAALMLFELRRQRSAQEGTKRT